MENVTAAADTVLRDRLVERIGALLPRVVDQKLPPAQESSRLVEDYCLGSSKMLELILELEDDMDIQIDVEEIDQNDMITVGSLAEFIAAHSLTDD